MKIEVAKQKIVILKDQFSLKEAEELAWQKKTSAFDAISKMVGFLSRPKDDDFELVYSEHRYQPFWHVVAKAKYVYDRNTHYQIAVSGKEVLRVTLHETDYQQTNGHIHIPVVEHCTQEEFDEVLVDGISGKNIVELKPYTTKVGEIAEGKIEKFVEKEAILVPPQARVSAIMRDSLSKMIKGIQADTILEESVEVPTISLYYRPVYAFQFKWLSKNKEGILEIDAITGTVASGSRIFKEYFGKALDTDFLFDIGADAAGMIIPGGSIAVKAARKYIAKK